MATFHFDIGSVVAIFMTFFGADLLSFPVCKTVNLAFLYRTLAHSILYSSGSQSGSRGPPKGVANSVRRNKRLTGYEILKNKHDTKTQCFLITGFKKRKEKAYSSIFSESKYRNRGLA